MTAAMAAVQERSGSPVAVLGYTPAYPIANILLTTWGTHHGCFDRRLSRRDAHDARPGVRNLFPPVAVLASGWPAEAAAKAVKP